MKRSGRRAALWVALCGMLVTVAVLVPLWVAADSEQVSFTATLYSDVIRFEADGAARLRVQVFDLAENELWSSGLVLGDFVDWDRTNARGERLANGYYLYLAQGWDDGDRLILNKAGKVVLLPGNQVELRAAPVVGAVVGSGDDPVMSPMLHTIAEDLQVNGTITATEAGSASGALAVQAGPTGSRSKFTLTGYAPGASGDFASFIMRTDNQDAVFSVKDVSADTWHSAFDFEYLNALFDFKGNEVNNVDKLGVGTTNVTDTLTIEGGSGNLIACYPDGGRDPGDAVFRVEADGDVYADGTIYSPTAMVVGSADVAERINVSEWVEAGDVVEIDPEHSGFFRKATGLYSRRVAGIISTSPGVILGNDIDSQSDQWDDNRPVLAIAGRVPVKVSIENGPIAVGDLLVSSSVPGIAMRGDPAVSIGAVVGKAMETLESGEGVIMAQVTLR